MSLVHAQHLEQEKHELRRRLESREGEWEGRVAELETDVQHLQGELERHQVQLREADRDKTKAIGELSEQNHRLLEQLSRVRSFSQKNALDLLFGSLLLCRSVVQDCTHSSGPGLRDQSAQFTLVT